MNLSASPGCPLQYIVCNYAINASSLSPAVPRWAMPPPLRLFYLLCSAVVPSHWSNVDLQAFHLQGNNSFFLQGQEGIASDQSHEVYMSFYEALGLKLVSFLPVHRDVP